MSEDVGETGSRPTDQAPVGLDASRVDPARVIARIVHDSQLIAWQAGVGGMETAGSIVSYLHEHPEDIPKLMDGTLSVLDWPTRWHMHGCLSWHGADGKLHHPASRIEQ
jgi:hypothetical protein